MGGSPAANSIDIDEREEDGTTVYEVSYDPENDNVVTQVVMAVAAIRDVDVGELYPLHAVVDPQGLRTLFDPSGVGHHMSEGSVTFPYEGFEVTVRYGRIRLEPAD